MLRAIKYEDKERYSIVPRYRYTRPPIFCIYEAPKGMGLKSIQKTNITDFEFNSGNPKPRKLPAEFEGLNNFEEVLDQSSKTNWEADHVGIRRLGRVLFAIPCDSERRLALAIVWEDSIEDTIEELYNALYPIFINKVGSRRIDKEEGL